MPNIVKGATGAALGTPANWVGGALPLTTDIAEWQSTPTNSLGPSLTGNLNVGGSGGGILVKGASNNITHSGGTITLGSGGYSQVVGNNRLFTTTGTISVAGNQTWTLYNPTGSGGLVFTGFTGTGNISIENADVSGASGWGSAYFVKQGATSTHTGTISLKDYTGVALGTATARLGTGTTISVDGEWCLISGYADNVIYTYNNAGIVVNADYCSFLNGSGRTAYITCPLTFNGYRKAYSYGNTSVAGVLSAPNGFENLGPSQWHLTGPAGTVGGTVKITSGWIILGDHLSTPGTSPNQLNGAQVLDIAGGTGGGYVQYMASNALTVNSLISGAGSIYINNNGGITFNNPDSTHSGWLETAAGSGFVAPKTIFTYTPTSPNLGLTVWNSVTAATSVAPWIVFQSGGTISSSIRLLSQIALTGSQNAYIIETNGDNSTLTQDIIQRTDSSPAAARIQVQLQGTGDNTVLQGRIIPSNLVGTVGITKTGTGKWTLENSSTCNGLTSLNQGTLVLKHDDAIGTSAGDVTLAGGTLQLSGGRNIVKTNRTLTFGGASILVDADTDGNSITCGGVTLNASAPITVGAGSTFTLSNTGAAIGSGTGIIKNGDGDLVIGSSANTFTGDFTVNGGNVTLQTIANTGLAASWGAGSSIVKIPGELKVIGAGGSTNRTIMFQGSTPSLDASGTGTITYSNIAQGEGDRTINLKGSNTGDNTLSAPVKPSRLYNTISLTSGRGFSGVVTLPNGNILFAGGMNGASTSLLTCELYNPTTNSWSMTGNLQTARWFARSIAYLPTAGTTGRVLIACGRTGGSTTLTALCELYNPSTGAWTSGPSATTARTGSTLTALSDGRALLVGGYNTSGTAISTVQTYNPDSGIGSWSTQPSISTGRYYHTATLLPNGKVLITGGATGAGTGTTTSCWLYNPVSNSWESAAPMSQSRFGHTATLISNGTKVLIAAGRGLGPSIYRQTYEIYDIDTNTWSTPKNMNAKGRVYSSSHLLNDGKVIVIAGEDEGDVSITSCEIYDPQTDVWTLVSETLPNGLAGVNSGLMIGGKSVLIAGGSNGAQSVAFSTSSLYNHNQITGLTKSGSGKWILSNSDVSYTGTTTISDGVLSFGEINRTLSGQITISGGELYNGSATINAPVSISSGTISATLAGAQSLNVTANATLSPVNSNTYTGTTIVANTGTLNLITSTNPSSSDSGKVTGSSSLTVNGTLKTGSSANQQGKARYGGNISFGSGAQIHIGGA